MLVNKSTVSHAWDLCGFILYSSVEYVGTKEMIENKTMYQRYSFIQDYWVKNRDII